MLSRALFSLSIWILGVAYAPLVYGSTVETYSGKVVGPLIYFKNLDGPLVVSSDNVKVTLELEFHGKSFSPAELRLSLNGLQGNADHKKWEKSCKWDDKTSRLSVDVSDLKFGNHEWFRDRVRVLWLHHGQLMLLVGAPRLVKKATLRFEHKGKVKAPRVEITSVAPAGAVIRTQSIRFEFSSPEGATSFECRHRGENRSFEPCVSPKTFSGLANGHHKFQFRAVDAKGKHGRSKSYSVWVVAPVPAVVIKKVVPEENPTSERSIKFKFKANQPTPWVLCQLDDGPLQYCRSPVKYKNLSDGEHTVRFRGAHWIYQYAWGRWLGGWGWFRKWFPYYTEPVAYTWRILSDLPSVSFTETPAARTRSTSAQFGFRSDNATSFLCALDSGVPAPCVSPHTVQGLSEGEHEFSVTPVAGPSQGFPIRYRWQVDLTPPELTVGSISPSNSPTNSTELQLTYSLSEPGTVSCVVDGGNAQICGSPVVVTGLADGPHSLVLFPKDDVGNEGEGVEYTWEVDTAAGQVSLEMVSPQTSPTSQTSARFRLTSSEPLSYLCSLDGGEAQSCAAEVDVTGLEDGLHEFVAWGVDGAGNAGLPAQMEWVVDTTRPVIALGEVTPSESPTLSTDLRVEFALSENAGVVCELDGGGQMPCQSPYLISGLAEGQHQLVLLAVDPAGNVSLPVTYAWQVRVIPTVQIVSVSPAGSPTSSTSLTVQFASPNATSFRCTVDGAAAPCASPLELTGLGEGNHRLEVRGLSSVGEAGPEAVYEWAVDLSGPTVVLDSVSPAQNPTSSTSLSVAFSASDAAQFFCALDGDTEMPCASPWVVEGLTDGIHVVSVVGVDSLGNRGNPLSYGWTVDTQGPGLAFTSLNPAGSPTAELSLAAAWSSSEPASFLCALDGGAEAACVSPHSVTVGEGSHRLTVVGVDAVGNRGPALHHDWVVSVPLVGAQIDSFEPATSPSAENAATVHFSAVGASGFRCSWDGQAAFPCTSPVSRSEWADGTHQFSVVALNAVGNVGPPAVRSWVVDRTGPVVTLSTNPNVSPTPSTTLVANFSASEAATFLCALDGGVEAPCVSPHTVTVAAGLHSLAVVGVDTLGNRGAVVSYNWEVEVPPAVVTLDSVVPSANPTSSRTIAFSFSGVGASSFECRLDGGSYEACVSPRAYSALADGAHEFSVRGLNAVGVAGASVGHSWTVDATGPVVNLTSVTPDWSPTSQNTLTATFSSPEAGVSFFCRLDAGAEVACASPHTFTELSDGSHSIFIQGADALGNRGAEVSYTWVVDSSALVISNVSIWNVTATSAEVRWETNFAATSQTLYGVGANLNQSAGPTTVYVTSHSMVITGLTPFTFYSVRARSVDRDGRMVESSIATFRTLR